MTAESKPVERFWTVHKAGWWYGIVFTTDPVSGAEHVVYSTGASAKQQDAAYDLLLWLHYQRGHKHPGPYKQPRSR